MKLRPGFVLSVALFAHAVDAQHSPAAQRPDGRLHAVTGIVVDSVRSRPLQGAEVVVAGTTFTAITDSLGRFRFDSLPPGSHRVAFFHPLLDSISLAVAPAVLRIPMEMGKAVVLAVPSIATLIRTMCRTDSVGRTSVLVGKVTDPETEAPVAGSAIFVTWTDFEVSRDGIRRTPQTIQGGTDSNGVYRVCGLPAEVEAVVYAIRDSSSTSRVPVSSTRQDLLIRNLSLENPATAGGRRASIAGRVRSVEGDPIPGATIGVAEITRTATSGRDGEYTLSGLPLGTRNIVVRRLGFAPASIPVELSSRGVHQVDVSLGQYVLVMDPMYVIAQRDRALAQIGFTERRRRGLGDYRTRSEFERGNPVYLSDILGTMKGVRVDYVGGRRLVRGMGQGADCVHMVIDGIHWESLEGDVDESIVPEHVAAVEVYSGMSVPTEFEHTMARGCLTVVVWTRNRAKDFVR